MKYNEKNYQRLFTETLKKYNQKTISHPSEISINELFDKAEKIARNADLSSVDCNKGCGYCCILNIPVLTPESWNIVSFINQNFSSDEISNIRKKINDFAHQIKNLDDDERIACRKECIFLDLNKSCSIYPVRPVLCRSVTSVSKNDCKLALESVFTGEENTVLMNTFIKTLYNDLFMAISSFLEEFNMNSKSEEITQAVKNIMVEHG